MSKMCTQYKFQFIYRFYFQYLGLAFLSVSFFVVTNIIIECLLWISHYARYQELKDLRGCWSNWRHLNLSDTFIKKAHQVLCNLSS